MITHLKENLILDRFPAEAGHVVLACIKKENTQRQILSMLEQFSSEMEGRVSVFIADEDAWGPVRASLKIDGTPVFIFYLLRREKCRILGSTTNSGLRTAIEGISLCGINQKN